MENADKINEKWFKITTFKINKYIADNNPTISTRKYTECGTYKNSRTIESDMMAAQNLAAKEDNPDGK
jgi:hypothetical protein